ncbi:MAG: HD-GYP domain-containing protein [Burkholderiaceae bacterium]
MFSQARMGKVPDLGGLAPMVEEISASVDRNREALITLARLKTRDDYTFMHSVAVCGLMIALARELELDEAQRRTAGLAGLVHDIGKMFVPVELLNKPGRLSDAEFDLVRRHPREGWTLLRQVPGIVPEALDVCLHHHEKHAGGGYPDGLSGESISLMARMGAVCDVYDAVTSQRAYNRGWDPADALRQMAGWRGHFDPHVFQAFVRAVGIYPTGSLVRLASGRLGVVIEQGKTSLLAPRVRVFFSARSREPVPVQVIEPGGSDRIVAREDPAQWGFERLDEHWAAA